MAAHSSKNIAQVCRMLVVFNHSRKELAKNDIQKLSLSRI